MAGSIPVWSTNPRKGRLSVQQTNSRGANAQRNADRSEILRSEKTKNLEYPWWRNGKRWETILSRFLKLEAPSRGGRFTGKYRFKSCSRSRDLHNGSAVVLQTTRSGSIPLSRSDVVTASVKFRWSFTHGYRAAIP